VLGGVLGIALALLREALDRRVRVNSDIELITGVEVLGTILPAPPRTTLPTWRRLIPGPKPAGLLPTPVKS
jgi:hypothetical protein